MRVRNYIAVLLLVILALCSFVVRRSFAQENVVSGSFPSLSPKEKIHALALTRFHFITLKQFHSALFSGGEDQKPISEFQAQILNAALNSFLTSAGREAMLLEALRQNRAVRLKFSVPEQEKDYEMVSDPNKPLLYQLKPVVRPVPVTVEIRPLLDQPVAFKIMLRKGNERHLYQVDWAGNITRAS